MDNTSPSIRRLALKLLDMEVAARAADPQKKHEAVRVCEKLRISLIAFAGADGFSALLRRSLALARAEFPALRCVSLTPEYSLDGLDALVAAESDGGTKASAALISHLLGLLITFVGEPFTFRLVREAWPNISLVE